MKKTASPLYRILATTSSFLVSLSVLVGVIYTLTAAAPSTAEATPAVEINAVTTKTNKKGSPSKVMALPPGQNSYSSGSTGVDGPLTVTTTVQVDAVKSHATGLITNKVVPVNNTTGFTIGQEILIMVMYNTQSPPDFSRVGLYETAVVEDIDGNNLILEDDVQRTYRINSNEHVLVQKIPHYTTVTVQSGGKLTASAWNSTTKIGGVVALRALTVTVESGGSIDASAIGYTEETGPGSGGTSSNAHYWGASHGGQGVCPPNSNYSCGSTYGNLYNPTTLGSGGAKYTAPAGKGGGVIHLQVNQLNLDGTISTNGGNGGNSNGNSSNAGSGGGSGGSVWIETDEILGSGSVQAIGGNGGQDLNSNPDSPGGGGGGGRIAIYTPNLSSSITILAKGGVRPAMNIYAAAGTIYLNNLDEYDRLQINNNGQASTYWTPIQTGNYEFTTIRLLGNSQLLFDGVNSNLTISGEGISGDSNAPSTLKSNGTVNVLTDLLVEDYILHISGQLSGSPTISTTNVGKLYLEATPQNLGSFTLNELTVGANTEVRLYPYLSNPYGVTIEAITLTVEANGKLHADGLGYIKKTGQGSHSQMDYSGASYGGQGVCKSGATCGVTYGNVYEPNMLGSGGGDGSSGTVGGNGGGVVHLIATTITLNGGTISANGGDGTRATYSAGGGGAGGSVWIETSSLSGTGSIQAHGGNGGNPSSNLGIDGLGGGGGRVAVYAAQLSSNINVVAWGGRSGDTSVWAAAGTVYLNENGVDKLKIDNNGNQNDSLYAVIPAGQYEFDTISLTGYGNLLVDGTTSNLIIASETIVGDTNELGILKSNGTLHTPSELFIDDYILQVSGQFAITSTLETTSVGKLYFEATPFNNGFFTLNELTVGANTEVRLYPYMPDLIWDSHYGVTIEAITITVEANSKLHADMLGYTPFQGTGSHANMSSSGASHGGAGVCKSGATCGSTYGNIYTPTMLGSGGGTYVGVGGRGGGAFHLVVSSILNQGLISANGGSGTVASTSGGGGGAGGSIWIEANSLAGTGFIQANGGNGGSDRHDGGGGGGGRIAIYVSQGVENINASAAGGLNGGGATINGQTQGGPGSVFIQQINLTGIVAPTTALANGVATMVITATITGQNNEGQSNAPLADRPVRLFSSTPSAQNSITPNAVVNTNANGQAVFTLRSTRVGPQTLFVQDQQTGITYEVGQVTFLVGEVNQEFSTVTANPAAVPADGLAQTTVLVTLRDNVSNPVRNMPVTIVISGTNNEAIALNPTNTQTTNAQGQIQATLSSSVIQTATVYALYGSEGITLSQTAVVTFTPTALNPAASTALVTPTTAFATGAPVMTVTATLTDIDGRPFAYMPMQLQADPAVLIFPAATQTTDANGLITFTIGSAQPHATVNLTLFDPTFNVFMTLGSVTFTESPIDLTLSEVVLVEAPLTSAVFADGDASVSVLALAKNSLNNPVVGATVFITSTQETIITQPTTTTDNNGEVVAEISHDTAEVVTVQGYVPAVSAFMVDVVTITFALPSSTASTITSANASASANGSSPAQLVVTVKSPAGLPIMGVPIVLTSTDTLVTFGPGGITNQNGQVTLSVFSTQPGTYPITAVAGEVVLEDTENVTFVGPDLQITMQGPSQVMAGFPATYNLTVKNWHEFTAEDVVVTATLPAGLTVQDSTPAVTQNGNLLSWNLNDLTANETENLQITLAIPASQPSGNIPFTVNVTGTTTPDEANLANNSATVDTIVGPSLPLLTINPPYPYLLLSPNSSGPITLTIQNNGSAPLVDGTINMEQAFGWFTLPPTSLNIPAYGGTQVVTFTAATTNLSSGRYHNTVQVQGTGIANQNRLIEVQVQNPLSDFNIQVQAAGGQPIHRARVELIETITTYTPDNPNTSTTKKYVQYTTAEGQAVFVGLESGKNYQVKVTADYYSSFNQSLNHDGGETITLNGLPQIEVTPAETILFSLTPEEAEARVITVTNVGQAPATGITATLSGQPSYVYLGLPVNMPSILEAGQSVTFTVNAYNPYSATGQTENHLNVTSNNAGGASLPIGVELVPSGHMTLCITVQDEQYNLLEGLIVSIHKQTGYIADTRNGMTNEEGQFCFTNVTPTEYAIEIYWDLELVYEGSMDIQYDSVDEVIDLTLTVAPVVDIEWVVEEVEFDDVYTATTILRFWPGAPLPRLIVAPDRIGLCGGPITQQVISLYNPYNVTFTDVVVTLNTDGVANPIITHVTDANGDVIASGLNIQVGQPITLSQANGYDTFHFHISFDSPPACTVEELEDDWSSRMEGYIFLSVDATYERYQRTGWYQPPTPTMPTSDNIPLDSSYLMPMQLYNPASYPEGTNLSGTGPDLENVTLTQPAELDWITVSTTTFPLIEVGETVTFNLEISPRGDLPVGTYWDYILVTASNGITAVIGLEAERTVNGVQVHTRFVTPLTVNDPAEVEPGSNSSAYNFFRDQMYNHDPNSIQGPQSERMHFDFAVEVACVLDCDFNGSYHFDFDTITTIRTFPVREGRTGSVYLQLQQRFTIARQALKASLRIGGNLDDISVNLNAYRIITSVVETQPITEYTSIVAQPYPFDILNSYTETEEIPYLTHPYFVVAPPLPTQLGDSSENPPINQSWMLIPDTVGVITEPMKIKVTADVHYTKTGNRYEYTTDPVEVKIYPDPLLVVDYFLPTFVYGNQPFEWYVFITNVGYGEANNVRIHTPQPVILNSTGRPISFELLNDSNIIYEEIAPGETVSQVYKIRPSESGELTFVSASCEHQNFQGTVLPPIMYCEPRIHWIDTRSIFGYWVNQMNLAKEACFTSQYQSFEGDPVNTLSGNFTYSTMDVEIPTWGKPLQFERSYNALTEEEPGPLGYGWTHNYNMGIRYEGFFGGLNLLTVRLPHGSAAYFQVEEDEENGGFTYTPLPGIRAKLELTGTTYTLTQECDQTVYIFENNGTQLDALLTKIIDGKGNETTFTYNPQGNLIAVTDPAGRSLTYDYTRLNNHWYMTSMTDPLSRTTTFTYTGGYLTEVIDPAGASTTYNYRPVGINRPQLLSKIINHEGVVMLENVYDQFGRVATQYEPFNGAQKAVTSFEYNPPPSQGGNYVTIITNPEGYAVKETYNSEGVLVSREDHEGHIEQFEYDDQLNLIKVTDKNGQETEYEWTDCNCDVTVITDSLGFTTVMTYNDQQQMTEVVDKLGHLTTITYEGVNPLTVTNALGYELTYGYGTRGELLWAKDSNGNTTWYGYDEFGNTAVITDALGNVTTMIYDAAGRLQTTTNALNQTTGFVYDPADNLLEMNAPMNVTIVYTYDMLGNMVAMEDPLGRVTTYEYNDRNQLVEVTDALDNDQQLFYNKTGQLIRRVDANLQTLEYGYDHLGQLVVVTNTVGHTQTFTYDPMGNLLSETDFNGHTTTYSYDELLVKAILPDVNNSEVSTLYDAAGKVLESRDSEGRLTTYEYDALGRLITITNPLNHATVYSYDANGNVQTVTDANGQTSTFEYDALNRLIISTSPLTGTTVITYDALGNRTAVEDANGRVWTYSYDDLNRLETARDPLGGLTEYVYDDLGNPILVIDPLERVTSTIYDDLNRPITITNPLDGSYGYTYDAVGNVLEVVNPEQQTTQFGYNELYQTVVITNAMGYTTSMAYDANGNVIKTVDAEGRVTTYGYNELNQLISVTNPISGTTLYEYDTVGNLRFFTDPLGRVTEYLYDEANQLIEVINPAEAVMSYAYDPVGNVITVTDFAGNSTVYGYNALNQLITVTNALTQTTVYTYDLLGNLLEVTNPAEESLAFEYDALNRLITVTDALGYTTVYTYDAVGNQIGVMDAQQNSTIYTYDALNRLVEITDPLNHTTVYTYSPAGNLEAVQNPLGHTTSFFYDELNRLERLVNPLDQATWYGYDKVNNQTSVTDALLNTVNFVYDPLNRPVNMIAPLGRVITYTYDAVGNQISVTDPNNQTTLFTYDELNQLIQVTDPLSNVVRYGYDSMGNPITVTDQLTRTTTYEYDALYRPVVITDTMGYTTSFGYDSAGNQAWVKDAAGRVTTFGYDALGQVITITDPLEGEMVFSYDELGNQTTIEDAEGRVYARTYDDLNRLVEVNGPEGFKVTYAYDAAGQLITVTDALDHSTTYTYNAAGQLITVTDALTGTVFYEYDAIGQIITQTDPLGYTTVYTYDVLRQTIATEDALGGVTQYEYDPAGNVITITDANGHTNSFGYDALNRVITVTNGLGESSVYTYNEAGENVAITDPLQNTTIFTYDDLGRLIEVRDPLQNVTTYGYDEIGNTTFITDARGIVTHYVYDPLDRLTAVTENYLPQLPSDHQTNVTNQFVYDKVGNLIAMIDPTTTEQLTLVYDDLNRLKSTTNALDQTYTYVYNPLNLVSMTDPEDQTTLYAYDAVNRLTNINRPDELVQFAYNPVGNRVAMTQTIAGQTHVNTYIYDELHRLTSVTDAWGERIEYGYDAVGNRTSLSYPEPNKTVTYQYDEANRLTSVTDWNTEQTVYTYDDNGRVTGVALPNGVNGVLEYDPLNRTTQMAYTNITGTLATYEYGYDEVGNQITATEVLVEASVVAQAEFSAAPRIGLAPLTVEFTNSSIQATSYVWNFGDGQTSTSGEATFSHEYTQPGTYTVTLSASNADFTHILTYTGYIVVLPPDAYLVEDGLLVVEAEEPHHNYTYDQSWIETTAVAGYTEDGYLFASPDIDQLYLENITTTSPELQYSAYFTDPGTYTVWVRGRATNAAGDSVYVGVNGEVIGAVTGFAPDSWQWSAQTNEWITSEITIATSGLYTIQVWMREDGVLLDRLIVSNDTEFAPQGAGPAGSIRLNESTAELTPHSYGTQESYSYVNQELGEALNWFYAWNNLLASVGSLLLAPLALVLPWAYNSKRKQLARWIVGIGFAIAFYGTGAGVVYGETPSQAIAEANNTRFLLPAATQPIAPVSTIRHMSYTYDPLNRLTSATELNGNNQPRNSFAYSYDSRGNRTSSTVNGVVSNYSYNAINQLTAVDGQEYDYDDNGNLLNDGQNSYSYDSANRLVTKTGVNGGSVTNYAYDGDGTRILEIVDDIRTEFTQDVAAALPYVLSARQGGSTTLSVWGLGLIGEEHTGIVTGSSWQYTLPDVLGSARQITDASGDLIRSQTYDPFGNLIHSRGDGSSRFGFAGEEQEADGQVFLRARTYDPGTGRFLQQDSMLGNAGQPRTLHRYAYAFNNPVNYTDPSGRMPAQGGTAMPMSGGGSGFSGASGGEASYSQSSNTGTGNMPFPPGSSMKPPSPCTMWNGLMEVLVKTVELARLIGEVIDGLIELARDGANIIGEWLIKTGIMAGIQAFSNFVSEGLTYIDNMGREWMGDDWDWVMPAVVMAGAVMAGFATGVAPFVLFGALAGFALGGLRQLYQDWNNGNEFDPWKVFISGLRWGAAGAVTGLIAGFSFQSLSAGAMNVFTEALFTIDGTYSLDEALRDFAIAAAFSKLGSLLPDNAIATALANTLEGFASRFVTQVMKTANADDTLEDSSLEGYSATDFWFEMVSAVVIEKGFEKIKIKDIELSNKYKQIKEAKESSEQKLDSLWKERDSLSKKYQELKDELSTLVQKRSEKMNEANSINKKLRELKENLVRLKNHIGIKVNKLIKAITNRQDRRKFQTNINNNLNIKKFEETLANLHTEIQNINLTIESVGNAISNIHSQYDSIDRQILFHYEQVIDADEKLRQIKQTRGAQIEGFNNFFNLNWHKVTSSGIESLGIQEAVKNSEALDHIEGWARSAKCSSPPDIMWQQR